MNTPGEGLKPLPCWFLPTAAGRPQREAGQGSEVALPRGARVGLGKPGSLPVRGILTNADGHSPAWRWLWVPGAFTQVKVSGPRLEKMPRRAGGRCAVIVIFLLRLCILSPSTHQSLHPSVSLRGPRPARVNYCRVPRVSLNTST